MIYLVIFFPYILQVIHISSSSCCAGSMDIPDPLSPLFPIVHRLWQDNIPYPHIAAECMFVLVVLLLHGHVWGSIRVHLFEFVPASPAVSCMSGSSNLNSFRDRRQVLWGVATRTCSRLHAAFLCNCRLASSPAVLLASM